MKIALASLVCIVAGAYLVGSLVTLKMERDNLAQNVSNLQQMVARSIALAKTEGQPAASPAGIVPTKR